MEEKFCPCCRNRCPSDRLGCHRGREYFGERVGVDREGDEVVALLKKCGHALHRGHGHGDIELDCFSEEERVQLILLLKRCLNVLEK